MATPLEPKKIEHLGVYGLIRPAEVDDSLIPDGAVTEVLNFSFDRKGASTVRNGMTGLGSTVLASRPCVGMHGAQGGTPLVVFSNGATSVIQAYSGGAWGLSLDGGTASVKIRFVDFGSYTIAINFMQNTYSSMRFWNAGTSRHWHHTGSPINPQNMWGRTPQTGEVYKNRVYLFGDTSVEGNPSRLYFSSVISSTGIITWNPNIDYVDINPGDGEGGTAIKRYSLELLCFKPNYTYRFRTSGVDPDPLIRVGTRSQESVIEGKKGLYFHHDSGFYRYSGGYPVEISRPISDIVAAISFSQYDDIASWKDDDHIYWSIGNINITESGLTETWRNVVVRFTESSELWTIYSMASDIRRGIIYNSGTSLSRIVANDMGVVATFDSGNTDLGEPIKYRMRTKWYDLGSVVTRKLVQKFVAVCEKAQAVELMYQTDENPEWKTIGQLKKMVNYYDNKDIRFHRIRFKVAGVSRFEPPIFKGIEMHNVIDEGIIKEN